MPSQGLKMKIQYLTIKPTQRSEELGCHALIPEMLASTGARYSRNNEGLDAILAKVDVNNQEKSIDTIFKHTDYGHASILGMVPIALFIDAAETVTPLPLILDERLFSDTVLRVTRLSKDIFLVCDIRYLNGLCVFDTMSYTNRQETISSM